MAKEDLKSMSLEELQGFMANIGEAKFRAKQVFEWIHKKQADSFSDMTNLSKNLREKLEKEAKLSYARILEKRVSKQDGTTKYLFALENDNIIESVLMRYGYGNAVCISTQVGCRMGCTFCASTLDGVERNLTAGEMLSQIYEIQKDTGERVSSVVLMGSGEPLDNYDNVIKFIKLLNDKDGLNIGQRHITLSTCGLIEKMYKLADECLQITLAVSLHAPNDEIRNKIMPVSKKNDMDRLLEACKYYSDTTKRRITFEYAMISGVNDSLDCAKELSERLRNMLCHINLIPVNDVKERNYKKSSGETVERFAEFLNSKGIETTVRRKLGSDINAACGQLRKGYLEKRQ
ncbi:MAG: 23S rRNA (adenine(2503)-C(2))-methyltransferase RlmN [Tyzzerella sp.]|uniref:Probable dual-specificity RNA methyltransferase RlmN n=1 Tax=Candidatus Fimicola merdigallinarum TaxID=2840819 RepID=A0A9D9DVR2_9FIRM|nr:23S rRNA (adenine(2503)-C(2))-methyltransferase RlmN [Candidatus Fimicola merdigallinarum]